MQLWIEQILFFIHVLAYIENNGYNQHFLANKSIPIERLLMPHIEAFEELDLKMLILKMCPTILALSQGEKWALFCIILVTASC